MRLDLFLKASRIVKRRILARELCEAGGVLVNSHEAKPAKEVKQGDVITLKFTSRIVDLEVLDAPVDASRKKTFVKELYRVKLETRLPREQG